MNKMKVCKVCQKEIAKSAKICPHCGAKLKMGVLKKIGIGFGVIIVLAIIGSINSKDSKSTNTSTTTTSSQQTKSVEKPKQSEPEKPNWNTKEVDIMKNGNIQIAVKLLKKSGDIKQNAEALDPATVIKTPWNYYGKVLKVTGTVAVVQDFPSGSDYSKELDSKDSSDIVIATQDETIVEMLSCIPSGSLKVGDNVTLYGYPVGNSEVKNRVGGKDTHLFLVGNSFATQ